jgi:hypothetical protein
VPSAPESAVNRHIAGRRTKASNDLLQHDRPVRQR